MMRVLTLLFWVVVAIAFAVYIWPTRWRYDHMTTDGNFVPVRIDRFSGGSHHHIEAAKDENEQQRRG